MTSLESLEEKFNDHMQADLRFRESIFDETKEIKGDIKIIKENHLTHIQASTVKLETNVDWLMRYHWIIATSSIGALVAGIINFIK